MYVYMLQCKWMISSSFSSNLLLLRYIFQSSLSRKWFFCTLGHLCSVKPWYLQKKFTTDAILICLNARIFTNLAQKVDTRKITPSFWSSISPQNGLHLHICVFRGQKHGLKSWSEGLDTQPLWYSSDKLNQI